MFDFVPKKLFWLCFFFILSIAVFLRFYQLGQVPVGLYWDEAAMYLDVKSTLQSGSDVFGRPWYQVIYPSYGDFKLPVYIWSALVSAKIFGLSAWSLRLPSALAGVASVVVVGLLARQIFFNEFEERKRSILQLVSMAIMTVSPWSLLFSRTAFEGHLAQFFLGLSLLMLLMGRRRKWLLVLVPLFAAISTYAYFSVRFVWVMVFIVMCCVYFFQLKKKIAVKTFAMTTGVILCYALMLVPLLRSPLYKDANTFRLGTESVLNQNYVLRSNVYRELAGNTRLDRVLFNSKVFMFRSLLQNYAQNTSFNFLFVTGDQNLRHGTQQHGVFLIVFLPSFVYGALALWQKNKRGLCVLFCWWMFALLPASVPMNVPHALRSLNAVIPLVLWIAYGTTAIVQDATYALRRNGVWRFFPAVVMMFFVFTSSAQFFYFYFQVYPVVSASEWQDGYQQLATAIYAQRKSSQDIIVVPFDDRFYIWLMAFGPYTAKDFHSWQSDRYHFLQFGNEQISFVQIDDRVLSEHQKPVLVAGKKKDLDEQLAKMTTQPQKIIDVFGNDPKQWYQILEFTK